MTVSINDGQKTYTTLDELKEYLVRYCGWAPEGVDTIHDILLSYSALNECWFIVQFFWGMPEATNFTKIDSTHSVLFPDGVGRDKVQEFVNECIRSCSPFLSRPPALAIASLAKKYFNLPPNTNDN